MNATTTEQKSTTVKTISFRFIGEGGATKQSKLSISEDIFDLLVKKFGDDVKAREWCSSLASKLKADEAVAFSKVKAGQDKPKKIKLSAHIRESALLEVIDPTLMYGYKFDPDFTTITCAFYDENKERRTAPINIPSTMMHALRTRFSDANREVRLAYEEYRLAGNEDAVNYSDDVRTSLLNLILMPSLRD
ncbi:hypothetical protein [Vibrio crassostreae]|uniref:hypothetical protein n=1 Tax=Vibrio crassostreae TaxID=246167 RepID=UPI001B302DC7|nr:hypothetical protein [Vibrio crassostreae]